jgi:streptogramin lyase
MAWLLTACTKKTIPREENPSHPGGGDSTVVLDTLPSFNSPSGITIDTGGNLYVADYGNNLIRKITPAGAVSTFAGSGNQGRIDATGVLASFSKPTGIAADNAGNLFVADAGNNKIRKITHAGVVSTFAGIDTTGAVNGPGNTASFYDPLSVAVDVAGNVYVADAGNNLIRKITPAGIVSTLAANDTTGGAPGMNNPTGVAINATGNVFVANYLNNNILLVSPAGTISLFAGTGLTGADNGPAASATFYLPNNVALDAAGNVYVADGVNNLIRKIATDGTVSTLAGSGMTGAIDSTGVNASFNGPAGLVVDPQGNVYVADANNNKIRKITPAGVVTTVAGSGLQGSKNGVAIAYRNRRQMRYIPKNNLNLLYQRKPK